MNWHQIVEEVTPHIVKIETQDSYGTGFLTLYNENKELCGVATAMHVVAQANEWQQPIRLKHHSSDETVLLKEDERIIFTDSDTDSAVILFYKKAFPLPQNTIPLLSSDYFIKIGVEVGWLGFPNVAPAELCFFSGNISARPKGTKAYLIDGVAIHGVSGGPVFYFEHTDKDKDEVRIVGTVSAYQANRATGEALPGLLIAQDVSHLHDTASTIQSIDEANKKKAELEASQKEQFIPSLQPSPPQGT